MKFILLGIFERLEKLTPDHGGVDRTITYCWQHQLGQMAEFLPLLTYKNLIYLKVNLRPCGTH